MLKYLALLTSRDISGGRSQRDKFRGLSALADSIVSGDPRAVARGISLVENDLDEGPALVRELFARSGRAFLVGITGAPGAGKSTLVDGLVSRWRTAGKTVGVLAVDPDRKSVV